MLDSLNWATLAALLVPLVTLRSCLLPMTSYRDLLAGLKDEPSLQSTHHLNYSKGVSPQNSASDSSRPMLTWPTNNNKKTGASVSKYQSLLGHTDEASDYSIRVMAAGLSSDKSTGPHLPSIDSSFEQFQMEVTKQVVCIFVFHQLASF